MRARRARTCVTDIDHLAVVGALLLPPVETRTDHRPSAKRPETCSQLVIEKPRRRVPTGQIAWENARR